MKNSNQAKISKCKITHKSFLKFLKVFGRGCGPLKKKSIDDLNSFPCYPCAVEIVKLFNHLFKNIFLMFQ